MTKTARKPHGQTRALKHFAPKPEPDKLANAKAQGQAQFESIKEMVEELDRFRNDNAGGMDSSIEDAEQRIHEDTLSVSVRSGWYNPCDAGKDTAPAEYEILLCTGGPAVRLIGELDGHGQPESCRMEVQDWFQPWAEYRPIAGYRGTGKNRYATYDSEKTLLAYARCFYFGEG